MRIAEHAIVLSRLVVFNWLTGAADSFYDLLQLVVVQAEINYGCYDIAAGGKHRFRQGKASAARC
jgi:hypothetical protein